MAGNPIPISSGGKVIVPADSAQWTVVFSGITVNTNPATPNPSGSGTLCQGCHVYCPGGTPFAGTFQLTHAGAEAVLAFEPLLDEGTATRAEACRWGYLESPATTMKGGSYGPSNGTPDSAATFYIMLYDRGSEYYLEVGLLTYWTGSVFDRCTATVFTGFFTHGSCDPIGVTASNTITTCFQSSFFNFADVGKNGTATVSRCT